ncbi:MAG: hypothetical protein V1706_08105 [Pseudomonadota bacterium]
MRLEKNSAEISATDLKQGDIILTGWFHFDQGRGNVASGMVDLITLANFDRIMLYSGNGRVLPQGKKHSASLTGALQETDAALVLRPLHFHTRNAREIVSQVDKPDRRGYTIGDAPLPICHHPESMRFYQKHANRQLQSGQQGHLHQRVPHTLDCSGLVFDVYQEAGFSLGSLDPRFNRPRDFVTAYRQGALQFVGILKGGETLLEDADDKQDIFRNLPKSRGFFIAGKKTEATPPPKPPPPPPARPAQARDPLDDIAPAQAATLKAAAENGSPFCEP